MMKNTLRLLAIAAAVLLTLGCVSVSRDIPDNITAKELFQKGQDAYEQFQDAEAAIYFYEEYFKRFPDDLQKTVEIEYEIAFIHYKENDLATAEQKFLALIDRYQGDQAQLLPKWPLTLAEKLIVKINEANNPVEPDPTGEAE